MTIILEMKWSGNPTNRPNYQIRRYKKILCCACQLVTAQITDTNHQHLHSFLPQELANNVPRLKKNKNKQTKRSGTILHYFW